MTKLTQLKFSFAQEQLAIHNICSRKTLSDVLRVMELILFIVKYSEQHMGNTYLRSCLSFNFIK